MLQAYLVDKQIMYDLEIIMMYWILKLNLINITTIECVMIPKIIQ